MNHSHIPKEPFCVNDYGIFKEAPVVNAEQKNIFPTLFYEFKIDIDNQKIIDDCMSLKENLPVGVQKSNMGGWQSDVYNLFSINRNITPSVQNLAFNVILAANDISQEHNLGVQFSEHGCDWWININDQKNYNVLHTHPGCALIALYYPKIDKDLDNGNLTLLRCDGSQFIDLYRCKSEYSCYELNAEEKTIYIMPANIMHYVKPTFDGETRISIAFNLSINNVEE